jgi:hypothetical protein
MSTTIPTGSRHANITAETGAAKPIVRVGVLAGLAGSAATLTLAGAADAAGVSAAIDGEPIPPLGFATLTIIGAAIGVAMALFARHARHPRPVFVRTTVALTALSLLPITLTDTDAATRIVLAVAHLVAAAIIVPPIARRLAA